MKFHGITMVGRFVLETLETLPAFDGTRDPGRLVYITNDEKVYYGRETEWSEVGSGGGFGELNSSFSNGDIIYPGFLYYIDTSSSPLSATITEKADNGDPAEDGSIISIVDISGSFDTNTFTIEASGGANILNGESIFRCDVKNGVYTFFYDSTYGWVTTQGSQTTPTLTLKPADFALDDTNVGSDGGNLWGMIETVDFASDEDGSIWSFFQMPPEWNEEKDILIELGYSLNGEDNNSDVDLEFDYYVLEDGDTTSDALSGSATDTITSSTSGSDENIGNWNSEEMTMKIDTTTLTDLSEYIFFKFTRLGSTDTYSGTFQLTNIKFYQ